MIRPLPSRSIALRLPRTATLWAASSPDPPNMPIIRPSMPSNLIVARSVVLTSAPRDTLKRAHSSAARMGSRRVMGTPSVFCVLYSVFFSFMTQRRVISAGPAPAGPYSPAIASGGLIFVSGLLATDAQGRIGGDITAQTRRVLDLLGEVLEAAGSDLAHAV